MDRLAGVIRRIWPAGAKKEMHSQASIPWFGLAASFFSWFMTPSAMGQEGASSNGMLAKVPSGVILVKGAWSSASDPITPLPEDAVVDQSVFRDRYFGWTCPLPPDWVQKHKGPPPSDAGRYVLAELGPAADFQGGVRGSILIAAQDLFFNPLPARNAVDLIDYASIHLESDYQVETAPKQIKLANRSFVFFAYWSPAAELHWYVLATEIRCHVVQIILTSRDTKLLARLLTDMSRMKLPSGGTSGGDGEPACIQDYARGENKTAGVDPVFTEHRFNPVPVRIVIGKDGRVRHIHFISAFPDQARAIAEAVSQWKFKPYEKDGRVLEVETGVQFGRENGR